MTPLCHTHPWLLASILGLLVGSPLAQEPRLPALTHLKESDTFAAARLTPSERKQILEEVERVSFDVPDSWEEELLVRRVSLGTVEGLVVQGTQRLCRGTGNCEIVMLRHTGGTWAALFQEVAPIGDGFGFLPEQNSGLSNLVVGSNRSAESSHYAVYTFDGRYYRPAQCHERLNGQFTRVPCR